MSAVDFLLSDFADLPKTRVGAYPAFVDQLLSEYLGQMQRVSGSEFIDRTITNEFQRAASLSDAVREVIALAISGDRGTAFARLDDALRQLGVHYTPTNDNRKFSGLGPCRAGSG